MSDELDHRLARLLAISDRPVDRTFVHHTEQLVLAEERFRRARGAAKRRLASDAGATATLVAAFLLLAKLDPLPESASVMLWSPTMAAVVIFALWTAIILGSRPAQGF